MWRPTFSRDSERMFDKALKTNKKKKSSRYFFLPFSSGFETSVYMTWPSNFIDKNKVTVHEIKLSANKGFQKWEKTRTHSFTQFKSYTSKW